MGSVGLMKNSTLICAPLMGESVEEMISEMHKAKSEGADLVEIRLDFINNSQFHKDLQFLMKNKSLPVVIVFRAISEGGQFECDNRKQLEVILLAKELGAEYIEIDFKIASDLMRESKLDQLRNSKIIVSAYVDNLTSSNAALTNLIAQMQLTGADIIKIVVNASDITETAKLFPLLSQFQVPFIACATGERGLISNLLGAKFGGFLVYGSIKENALPGLPTINSLKQVYKVEYLDAETKVIGLVSKPVSHSKGPLLHNPTFRHAGYNGIYVPMFVDNLKEFFTVFSDPEFAGFSVGIPYKEAVLEFCDEVHPLAQRIGAVNTIVRRPVDRKLIGYNTDCEASITAIEDALKAQGCINGEAFLSSPLSGKLFVLVGAGGAGRALGFGAKSRGTRVVVFDIDFDRAKSLADAVDGEAYPLEQLIHFRPEKGAILANATPIGMHPNKNRIPVAAETLKDYKVVFDAVYTPRKTTLLKEAEAAGAIIVSGVEMFLRQAIGQFNLFTGDQAPEEFMREIVLAKF